MIAHSMPVATERQTSREWISDDKAMSFFCVVFAMFCFRDTLTGSLRYYLALAHLDMLWFVADALSILALVYFACRTVPRNRSVFGWIMLLNCVTATIIGVIFMNAGMFATISAVKMILPIFLGYAFCGRSMVEVRWLRHFLLFMSLFSATGLLLGPFVDFPWIGASVEHFGSTKEVGRVIWSQGELRYGGFAGENTMAAFTVVFPYFMIHRHLPKWLNVALWVPYAFALINSNSKTAMMISGLFIIYYVVFELLGREWFDIEKIRRIAKWSFVFVPFPFILMALFGGVDLAKISPILFSMQDRIQNTWQIPFTKLADMAPAAIITGCGLGCFTYPMQLTELESLWVPVDNFYIATYVMLGVPFIITVFGMFTATFKSNDFDKLFLMALLNLYTVTVQSYGPSTATILVGYAFSDMFIRSRSNWKRKARGATVDSARPTMVAA